MYTWLTDSIKETCREIIVLVIKTISRHIIYNPNMHAYISLYVDITKELMKANYLHFKIFPIAFLE